MCQGTLPLHSKDLERDTRNESFFNSFPYRNNRELRPITFLVPWSEFGDLWRIVDDVFSDDEIIRMDRYLITHPVVNRKLLDPLLNLRLHMDRHLVKVLASQDGVTEKYLNVVDTLFEELAEQLPLRKKQELEVNLNANFGKIKEEMLGVKTLDMKNSLPQFIREFFETTDLGLTEEEFSEISKNLLKNPTFEHVKRSIYIRILDDRIYFDNLLQKIDLKGLRKQENRRKLKQHRIKTIKSISKELLDPDLQPSMKKYAIKIQKHVSQNVN